MGDKNPRVFMIASQAHHQALIDGLWNFYLEKQGSDFDFEWKGQSIQAHRLVIDVFLSTKDIVSSERSSSNAEMHDLDLTCHSDDNDDCHDQRRTSSNLDLLMEFLYKGKVMAKGEQLDNLLTLARELNFTLLVDAIAESTENWPLTKDSHKVKMTVRQRVKARPVRAATKQLPSTATNQPASAKRAHGVPAMTTSVPAKRISTAVTAPTIPAATADGDSVEENVNGGAESECGGSIAETETDESKSLNSDEEIDFNSSSECDGGGPVSPSLLRDLLVGLPNFEKRPPETAEKQNPNPKSNPSPKSSRQPISRKKQSCCTAAPVTADLSDNTLSSEVDGTAKKCADKTVKSHVEASTKPSKASDDKCPHCPYMDTDDRKLSQHIARHSALSPQLRCDVCSRVYLTNAGLNLHMAYHRRQDALVPAVSSKVDGTVKKCAVETFKTNVEANANLSKETSGKCHRRQNALVDPVSSEVDGTAKKCAGETIEASGNPIISGKCPHCPYEDADWRKLRRHINRHSGLSLQLRCENCSRVYLTKDGLDRHLEHHRRQDPQVDRPNLLPCTICPRVYRSKLKFDQHVEQHRREEIGVTYRCPHCTTTSKMHFWLKSHLEGVHGLDADGQPLPKPYACDSCDKRFVRRHQLNTHVGIMHTVVRRFPCQLCPYASNRKADLRIHARAAHERDEAKQLLCETCGYKTFAKSSMVRHRTTHQEVKPFACAVCSSSYSTSAALRHHAAKHEEGYSEEMARCHVCHVCGARYQLRVNLLRHLRKNHPEEVVPTRTRGRRRAP